jgi:phenylpyruvate tautomerase PptA (4-oxalocrotonate tautomerase family)
MELVEDITKLLVVVMLAVMDVVAVVVEDITDLVAIVL